MSSLKLALSIDANNPNAGDLYLENGTLRLTKNLSEEVAQLLWTRFRSFQGEWFLDSTIGFPWFQVVLGQKVSLDILNQEFKFVVSTCPGVASIGLFQLQQLDQRAFKLIFTCTLSDGTTLKSSDFSSFVVPNFVGSS